MGRSLATTSGAELHAAIVLHVEQNRRDVPNHGRNLELRVSLCVWSTAQRRMHST